MFFKPITHSSLITTADKQLAIPEIIKTEGKPPRGRPPSPDSTETESSPEEAPSWRRSASFRNRQQDTPSEYISTYITLVLRDNVFFSFIVILLQLENVER